MPSRHQHRDERAQLDLFRALPGDLAPRDAQDLMAYPFFSLAKSKRLAPIDFKAGSVKIRVEAVAEHGLPSVSVSDVEVSRDMAHAKVFVTALQPERSKEAMDGLKAAAGEIRFRLARAV